MTFEEWLEYGKANKWCSQPDCWTHSAMEMTDEEYAAFDDGDDLCILAVRIYVP